MADIYFNIDLSELTQAVEMLETYAKQVPKKAQALLDRMVKEGEFTAKILLQHVDTGETLNSIVGYRNGNKGVIVVGGAAVWLEFGTGVYAPGQSAYPLPLPEGIVPHGTYGQGKGSSHNGWYYKNRFGEIRHTFGFASHPFMYQTAEMLKRQCPQMAKEIFSE